MNNDLCVYVGFMLILRTYETNDKTFITIRILRVFVAFQLFKKGKKIDYKIIKPIISDW